MIALQTKWDLKEDIMRFQKFGKKSQGRGPENIFKYLVHY